jgi:hypothetical protein
MLRHTSCREPYGTKFLCFQRELRYGNLDIYRMLKIESIDFNIIILQPYPLNICLMIKWICVILLISKVGKVSFDQHFDRHHINAWYYQRADGLLVFETHYILLSETLINEKFWEELIAYFPWYDTGHIKNDASNNSSIVALCIRCRGNVSTKPLPSNDKGDFYRAVA